MQIKADLDREVLAGKKAVRHFAGQRDFEFRNYF